MYLYRYKYIRYDYTKTFFFHTLDIQTLDSCTNPRQVQALDIQTLDRYKPQAGTIPRQYRTLDRIV